MWIDRTFGVSTTLVNDRKYIENCQDARLALILSARSSSYIWSAPNWFPSVNHLFKIKRKLMSKFHFGNLPWSRIMLPPKDLDFPAARTHPLDHPVHFIRFPARLPDL